MIVGIIAASHTLATFAAGPRKAGLPGLYNSISSAIESPKNCLRA
jgi:hypothetical protein